MVDTTLQYYEKNAAAFALGTMHLDFHETQDRFLRRVPSGGLVLDFGCGAGRDSKYFREKGYQVEAVDGSLELCRIASEYTGIPVRRMLFQELAATNHYDGIWACSSILHLPKKELGEVFGKMQEALKPGGTFYTSFKLGTFEGIRNGRYFTDFTPESFEAFLGYFPGLSLEESWITGDIRPGRREEKWLNLLLKKQKVVQGEA